MASGKDSGQVFSSWPLPVQLNLTIASGAIEVNGARDPEAVGEEVVRRLKDEVLLELEESFAASLSKKPW